MITMAADDAAAAARDGQTALALRLAKHLAPPPPGTEEGSADTAATTTNTNVAFSPLSVHAALSLAAAGARGATLAQLLAFLGAPSADELVGFGRRVADRVLADRFDAGGPRVLFGGGVWVDAARGGLTDAFRDVAAEAYKSEARTVSFTEEPEAAAKMINEWMKKATDNLIDSMISTDDINSDTDLVLANAVYFKGDWMEPFNYMFTEQGTFHRLNGDIAEAEFMVDGLKTSSNREHDIACMDGFKVLKLPYKPGAAPALCEESGTGLPARGKLKHRRRHGNAKSNKATLSMEVNKGTKYSMFIFLPDAHDGLSTMVDMVTASPSFLYGILNEMEKKLVNITLPKFEITFSWSDLKRDLIRLGLSLPFSPKAADLRGMCNGDDGVVAGGTAPWRPLFLTKVAHKAVVKVNEVGTEAAVVTVGMWGGGPPPPGIVEFTADHPFTFFIMEERSGVIVFAGHVLDPTK